MNKNNLTAGTLLSQWTSEIRKSMSRFKKKVLYWEDLFNYTNMSTVDAGSIMFAVWKDKSTLHSIVQRGVEAILSAGWYIHAQSKWTDFYDNEPFSSDWTTPEKALVHGGAV